MFIEAGGIMNPSLAQQIMILIPSFETPLMATLSLTVALFKSYGIVRFISSIALPRNLSTLGPQPSIASLLANTGQLAHHNFGWRMADVSVKMIS
jgi:hypothetical protein